MKRLALAAFAVILAVITLMAGTMIFDPISPIESCLDHGARWNYSLGKCECTPEELSSPAVTKEMIAHCNAHSPAPKR
jgi:hypothetical protein